MSECEAHLYVSVWVSMTKLLSIMRTSEYDYSYGVKVHTWWITEMSVIHEMNYGDKLRTRTGKYQHKYGWDLFFCFFVFWEGVREVMWSRSCSAPSYWFLFEILDETHTMLRKIDRFIYIYIYTYMCIYMYMCVHIYTPICIYIYMHSGVCTYTYIYLYLYI